MATHSVMDGGGDFTTLAAALADAGTSAGDTIEISGTWDNDDTAACTVADNNITIQAVGSSKCAPFAVASPTHYRLRCATNGSHCILVNNTGCVIDGLEIKQGSTGSSDEGIRMAASGGTLTVKNSHIYGGSSYVIRQDGIYINNISATLNLENCIIHTFDRTGIHDQNYTAETVVVTVNVNSCTIFGCGNDYPAENEAPGGIGVDSSHLDSVHNINVFNSVVVNNEQAGSGAEDFAISTGMAGTITWNIHNSIDSDNSIASRDAAAFECLASRTETDSDTPGAGNWVVFEDVTTYPYDLRLKSNVENDAQDAHDSGSGAGIDMPDADIAGTTRPQNTNYDCGAFEIAAAGGESGTVVFGHESETFIEEDNIKPYTGNWSGTGAIVGSGNDEKIRLAEGQYMEMDEPWNLTSMRAIVSLNKYGSGDAATIKYKDGDSAANCEADDWNLYTVPFVSSGWIMVRLEK
jgi:hypothetical protein